MPLSAAQLDREFALLEAAAAAGKRCPQSKPFGPLDRSAATELARAGRIRVEIFRWNWRVVTILAGPHRGKRTAPCPHEGAKRPYKVIDEMTAPSEQRREPWSPMRNRSA